MTKGEPLNLEKLSRDSPVAGEVRLYCWLDANLRELVDLLKESVGALREGNINVSLYSVYQAPDGKFVRKRLGSLESFRRGKDDFLELRAHSFKLGDFLNLVVMEKKKEEKRESKEKEEKKRSDGSEKGAPRENEP